MLRLTLLLSLAMFAALMTLGEDRGQLRPGLALAKSEGRLDEVWAVARAKTRPSAAARAAELAASEPVVAATAVEATPAVATPAVDLPTVLASAAAPIVVEVEPAREVVQEVREPVFTLSAIGTERVPGSDGVPTATAAPEVPEALAADSGMIGAEGTIWFVTANSVNVRAGPSTETEVLGKLSNGEAALLISSVDGEWARIVIQGDGMEGYVALRFLSSEAP